MSDINWSLFTNTPNFLGIADQAIQGREQDQQKRVRKSALAMFATDPDQAAQTALAGGDLEGYQALSSAAQQQHKLQATQQVGGLVASGDFAGAQKQAAQGGDFDLYDKISKMSADQRAQAKESSDTLARVGYSLKDVPYEKRAAVLQGMAPMLAAHGVQPEMLQKFDPTDANIDAAVSSAMDLKTALAQDKPVSVAAGSHLVDPRTGRAIYDAPEATKYVSVAPGADLHIFNGQGGSEGGVAPSGPAPDYRSLVQGVVNDGGRVTSGYRTPEQQAALRSEGKTSTVNSHHMEGDPSHPGAYDLAPPPGQSTAQLKQRLIQQGFPPDKLLDEGNHVHVTIPSVPGPPGAPVRADGHQVIHGPVKAVDTTELDDNSIDYVARQFTKTGQMPPLGMGKEAGQMRREIIKRAAQLDTEAGRTGEDAVVSHAAVKSAASSLTKVSNQRNIAEPAEKTVISNANFLLTLAPKGGGQTGSPVLNRFLQHARGEYAGDPDVSAFNNTIGTVADEYAKVMSGGTGSQAATDSSRAEAYRRLSSSATLPQLRSNIAAMKVEMANRITSLKNQEGELQATIRNGGVAPTSDERVSAAKDKARRNWNNAYTGDKAKSAELFEKFWANKNNPNRPQGTLKAPAKPAHKMTDAEILAQLKL